MFALSGCFIAYCYHIGKYSALRYMEDSGLQAAAERRGCAENEIVLASCRVESFQRETVAQLRPDSPGGSRRQR